MLKVTSSGIEGPGVPWNLTPDDVKSLGAEIGQRSHMPELAKQDGVWLQQDRVGKFGNRVFDTDSAEEEDRIAREELEEIEKLYG